MDKIVFIQIIFMSSLISVAIWSIILNFKNKFIAKDMFRNNLIGILSFIIAIVAGFMVSYTNIVIAGAILCVASAIVGVLGYNKDKDSKLPMSEVAILLSVLYITSATVIYMI